MTVHRHCAPAFEVALGDDGIAGGLRCDERGGLAMVEEDASIRQAIRLLLSTAPGERVMRPHYGCDLRQLLFAPNDATTAGLAIHLVRQALARFEPRVDVVTITAAGEGDQLLLRLTYRTRTSGRESSMDVPVSLGGAP